MPNNVFPSGDVSWCERYEAGQFGRETAGLLQGHTEVLINSYTAVLIILVFLDISTTTVIF